MASRCSASKNIADDIKAGDDNVLKAVNHHRVNVVTIERIGFEQTETGISHPNGEMRQVINNKRQHDQSAHRPCEREAKVAFTCSFSRVARSGRARRFSIARLNGEVNVQEDGHEKKNPDDPEERAELTQMFRVTVDPLRPEKNLQVAEQMSDDEHDQNQPGDRDDHFLPDRRAIKGGELSHNLDFSLRTLRRMAETRRRVWSVKLCSDSGNLDLAERAMNDHAKRRNWQTVRIPASGPDFPRLAETNFA